ncbi:MAG: TAXI family TRAP transporter solute-binding subunit [Hyphomicrobiales bacterium]|nr:TAXI family TRAP transporter solute-binding subunit [Hyphomicrobiales bacterium]
MRMKSLFTRREALMLGAGAAALIATPGWLAAQSRIRMTIVTGGTGGVFYPYGGGLARILSEKVPNIQATAQVTGGSGDNCKLVNAGEAEIGFSTVDVAYDAANGQGAFAKDGKLDVMVLASLYDSFMHMVAVADPSIAKIADLKGKRMAVGPAGSSTEIIGDRVLEAAGLNPKTDITRDNLSVAESVNALKDGKIQGFFWIGGTPTAAVRDLATTGQPPIRFLDTSAELAALDKKFPGLYRPFKLSKSVYAGMTDDVNGLGVANLLVVSSKLPNDTVTAVLEGLFGNLEEVQKIHPEAKKLTLQSASVKTAIPYHPAAEAFYKKKAG